VTELLERQADVDRARPSAAQIARALGRPEPTPEQAAVIEAPLQPLVVVAGAGSGKTETMASRVVWLVAGGDVAPDEVLGLTFTRKAAGELAERIRSRLRALRRTGLWRPDDDAADLDVSVSTYPAYAGRLVREHGLRLGYEPEARLLTEAACWQLASEIVERWTGDMDAVEFAASTVTEAVLQLAGEAAEHLVDLDEIDDYLAQRIAEVGVLATDDSGGTRVLADVRDLLTRLSARRQVIPIVRAYRRAKRERDSLDFGDQLAVAAELAQRVPQLGELERGRYRAVLLDEFQDTSHAQLVMLEALFGGGHCVTAVGDPHQSIYGWRGASADTLAGFAQRFRCDDGCPAPVRHLSTSWRNDVGVLAVANAVAEPLRSRTAVEVRPLIERPGAGAAEVQVATLPTAELEAAAVVDWVAERWLDRNGLPVPGRTAAVLCRRRAQFTDIEAALLQRGLPYQVVGLGGLLSTPEVADLLSALHVVHDPSRGDLLMRLLTGPSCRLGAHDLVTLGAWSRELHRRRSLAVVQGAEPQAGHGAEQGAEPVVAREADAVDGASLVEALDELPPVGWRDREGRELSAAARRRLGRLSDTLRGLRGRTSLPLAELVVEVERTLLLDVELSSRPGVSPAQARAHLDAIADVAGNFESSAEHATLGAFLSWLKAADEQERGLEPGQVEVDEHVVQVMTVHAAKGLEWDVVAVPGMVEGSFPQHKSQPRPDAGGWVMPKVTSKGWLGPLGAVPHALRGDRRSLPDVRWSAVRHQKQLVAELSSYYEAGGEHAVAEERRLAYVATTRARSALLMTGHVWGTAKTPRLASRFVTELVPGLAQGQAQVRADLAARVRLGAVSPMPEPGADRPDDAGAAAVPWPQDPLGDRRSQVEQAAARVRAALAAGARPAGPADEGADGDAMRANGVDARTVALLLAERDRGRQREVDVALPTHVSASRLVQLQADPDALALAMRRPLPREPLAAVRRGTAFHAWVEQFLGAASFLDVLDLPGSADDDPAGDGELEQLKERFLASEWASRRVVAVEVPLETPIDGTVVRGRVDAVFARDGDGDCDGSGAGGGVEIVDWKTGPEPSGTAARARAVQLAAYRLAWHRLHGVPLERIGAAFFYVSTGRTVRPADLLDEAGLTALLRALDPRHQA
jgi:DNA helicase-2/ATP-dependent DNA helicase PcrA